jgi:glycine/D-amino acid oxidase-like deaminating enzyme
LLELVGLLAFADRANEHFGQITSELEAQNLPHEILSGPDAARRFDMFDLGDDVVAVHAPRNGYLHADRCLEAMQDGARRHGATVWDQTEVLGLEPGDEGVVIRTADRRVLARQVVITAGPWLGRLMADLALPLRVTREQKVYFNVAEPARFQPERMPVFAHYTTDVYGFPRVGPGIKVAIDHSGQTVDPNDVDRTVDPAYIRKLTDWLQRWMPAVGAAPMDSAVCLYTSTPDLDFIIDRHPAWDRVVVAGVRAICAPQAPGRPRPRPRSATSVPATVHQILADGL